jgi:uncharacterized protein (TIGR02996 family)
MIRARLAPGVFPRAARLGGSPLAMAGIDDEAEAIGFETSPTGRFGIAAVSERERATLPMRAQGTPRRITAPIASPAAAPSTCEFSVPTIPDALFDGASPLFDGASSLFDGPTLDGTPLPGDLAGLLEERGPLEIEADEPDAPPPIDDESAELALLAAISAGDESSRLVYADWLEARDDHARAGFLRIEQLVSRLPPRDPRREACTRQLRELAPHVDPAWRARVARPPVEGCPKAAARCPTRWDALARTERDEVRYCGTCARHVQYFESVDEARAAARQGRCVAIDLGAERWENDLVDLGTRCWSCARRIVSSARYCPHCGEVARSLAQLRAGADDDADADADGDA